MTTQSQTISISGATLTIDQFVLAVRQLDAPARARLARALLETDLDARLSALIGRLAQREPADDIPDADIATEVRAVRQQPAGRDDVAHRR